jgi:hypothetical protein
LFLSCTRGNAQYHIPNRREKIWSPSHEFFMHKSIKCRSTPSNFHNRPLPSNIAFLGAWWRVPQFMPLSFAQAKPHDKHFWKSNFDANHANAQHALMRGPVFVFEAGSTVLFVFCLCSQCVLIMFSCDSPKFPSCSSIVKRWIIREHICVCFAKGESWGVQRHAFIGWVPYVPKELMMGQSSLRLSQ